MGHEGIKLRNMSLHDHYIIRNTNHPQKIVHQFQFMHPQKLFNISTVLFDYKFTQTANSDKLPSNLKINVIHNKLCENFFPLKKGNTRSVSFFTVQNFRLEIINKLEEICII